jgi:hypothetical protein
MKILYANCVPILTYCCEVKSLSSGDMRQLNTAVNDCIRKIFTFQRWESVRDLRTDLGYQGIYDIFNERQRNFVIGLSNSGNRVLLALRLQFCN